MINNKNVTSAIFLLEQEIDALEFLNRIKLIALYFNSLTNTEIKAIKNWIENTVVKELADPAIEILEAKKEGIESVVSRNIFMLDKLKEDVRLEVAKNLLDILDDETISIKTGLDIEKIRELRRLNK